MKQKITFLLTALVFAGLTLNAQTLVAHYKFDGNLNDETGNWNLTESAGFTATFETGRDATANGAVTGFNAGGAEYLETASNFSIFGATSRTMTAWIKVNAITGFKAIVGLGEGSTDAKWTWGIQGAKARIEITGTGFTTDADLTADTWYHVGVVYDDTAKEAKLYINGALDKTVDWSARSVNTTQTPLRVGNDYNQEPPNRGFNGAIDDLRIYTGASSDAQMTSIYTLALNKLTQEVFNAYPNPVQNRLYFSTKNVASVDIFNLLGSKISSQIVNDGVDMSNLSKGVYLARCKNSDGINIATIKVVKQ